MYLVAMAWLYVVVLMALAEGIADNGSWLGATITLLLYGVLPLAIVLYLLGTPARRSARLRREASARAAGLEPDGGGHAAGDAVAAEGEKP